MKDGQETRQTVLLAEDSPSQRARFLSQLEESGYHVIWTADGSQVGGLLEAHDVDIIVSDTELEGVDGDQACRALLKTGKAEEILIVGMSSVSSCEDYWKGVAHEFVRKTTCDHLGRAVEDIHRRFKTRDAHPRLGGIGA